jgi:o-succinylbenzoate synthase
MPLKISFIPYNLHFNLPFKTSTHVFGQKTGFLISIFDGKNSNAMGDVSVLDGYGTGSYKESFETAKELISRIKEFDDIPNVLATIEDLPALHLGFEQAYFSYLSKIDSEGLSKQLGIVTPREICVNGVVGLLPTENTMNRVHEFVDSGYNCIKLKVGSRNFRRDIELVRLIRKEYEDISIRLDANGIYTYLKAKEFLFRVKEFDIDYIEEPMAESRLFEKLYDETGVRIAADESASSIKDIKEIIEYKSAQVIILKPYSIGSLFTIRELIESAEEDGISVTVTTTLDSSIGSRMTVLSSTFCKLNNVHGLSTSSLFSKNLGPEVYPIKNGKIFVNEMKF